MALNYTDAAYQTDQAAIERRRKLILALMQAAPQQTMAGGVAVAASPINAMGHILSVYLANRASDKLDQQSKDVNTKYQDEMGQRLAEGLKAYDSARAGTPPTSVPYADTLGGGEDSSGSIMKQGTAPDPRAAMLALINSNHPILQQMGSAMMTKQPQVSPVSANDFTPESLAKFAQTMNYADLAPRVKGVTVNQGNQTTLVNPESGSTIGAPLPTQDRTFVQSGGKQVLADKNALPLGTTVNPGITDKDMADLFMRGAQVGDARANTQYNTGQTPGVFMPPGLGGAGFMTGARPGAAPTPPTPYVPPAPTAAPVGGAAPSAPSALPPRLQAEAQAAVLKKEGEGLAQGGVDYKNALDTRVQTGSDLMMRIQEARGAMDQFKPGMGADARLQVARVAQAIPGVPDSLVNKINGGDVSAKQEFQKLAAQQAMETLKQSMGGSGRITQAEFKVFQANNPNIELDPNAIQKIYNFATRVYQRDSTEQQQLNQHIKGGGRLSEWPSIWNQRAQEAGLVNPQIVPVKDGASVNKPQEKGLIRKPDGSYEYVP